MRILFLSDIHGSITTLRMVLNYYDAHHYDLLVLLGDILNYGPRNGLCDGLDPQAIADELNKRAANIVAVRGNCDSEVDQMLLQFPVLADYAVVVDNGRRLFLTHGHVYNEEHMPPCRHDAFFYGHTHLWKLERSADGCVVCNTGSVTFPKGGNVPTFAVLDNGRLSVRAMDGTVLASIDV